MYEFEIQSLFCQFPLFMSLLFLQITFMAQLNNKVDTDIEAIALDDIAITVGACKTGKYIYIFF